MEDNWELERQNSCGSLVQCPFPKMLSMSQRQRRSLALLRLVFVTIKHWMRRVDKVGIRVIAMEVL